MDRQSGSVHLIMETACPFMFPSNLAMVITVGTGIKMSTSEQFVMLRRFYSRSRSSRLMNGRPPELSDRPTAYWPDIHNQTSVIFTALQLCKPTVMLCKKTILVLHSSILF